jgi:hypothetical protein
MRLFSRGETGLRGGGSLPEGACLQQDKLLVLQTTFSIVSCAWIPRMGQTSAFTVASDHVIEDVSAMNTTQGHDPHSSLSDDL